MTENDSVERAHAEQLMAAFAVVLTHPAGFRVELATNLWIRRLQDGQFQVAQYANNGDALAHELFDDVRSAVAYYLDQRDELKLGNDYESAST